MSLCDSLLDKLGGKCSMVGNTGLAFELVNMYQGLSFKGRKFGDERWSAGENSPRNVCLLAVHGGTMPAGNLVLPTIESYGTCCAIERSSNGNYWWDSCHMGEAKISRHHGGDVNCTNSQTQKNCLNFAMLAPSDVFSGQISTGALCLQPPDDDGTPYRVECHFSEWPAQNRKPASLSLPQPPAPAPPPKASVCDSLTTTLGATCSPLYSKPGKVSFELVNLKEGLSYGGLNLGDEHWSAGQNSPRNTCLLAVYGGTMPSNAQEMIIPTEESYAQCWSVLTLTVTHKPTPYKLHPNPSPSPDPDPGPNQRRGTSHQWAILVRVLLDRRRHEQRAWIQGCQWQLCPW